MRGRGEGKEKNKRWGEALIVSIFLIPGNSTVYEARGRREREEVREKEKVRGERKKKETCDHHPKHSGKNRVNLHHPTKPRGAILHLKKKN